MKTIALAYMSTPIAIKKNKEFMEKAKRIPYGVSDFVDIIERNQYYVDKTMYLPMIEDEADSLFNCGSYFLKITKVIDFMCLYPLIPKVAKR